MLYRVIGSVRIYGRGNPLVCEEEQGVIWYSHGQGGRVGDEEGR
jgi:hypothetical protein